MTSIEELTSDHFELVAGWLSKKEINQWLTGEWRGRVITATLIAIAVRNLRNRLYLVRSDAQPCGLTALADLDTADRTAMVWYLLGEPAFAGRGIISAALRQTVGKCFEELRLESLYAWVMEDNIASAKVLQKVGFLGVGRVRKAAFSNGRRVDRIYFDLLASDCQEV